MTINRNVVGHTTFESIKGKLVICDKVAAHYANESFASGTDMTDATLRVDTGSKGQEKWLIILMVLGIIFALAFHVSPFWKWSYLISFKLLMAGLAAAAFINASLLLGYKKAAVFLALGAVIGFSMEQIGIWTGAVFGPYTYSAELGAKIIDVPWVIPLCWFAAVYFAHVLANLIIHARPEAREKTVSRAAIMAILTALIATGLDLALDPAMSHKVINAWHWTDGGQYMGVPFKNFQGWVLTAFLIDFLFRLYTKRQPAQPISEKYKLISNFAVLAWVGLGIGYMVIGLPVSTQLIAVFSVLLPGFLALTSLYGRSWDA